MYVLVILILMTAADQLNIARGSGFCGPPDKKPNTVPVNENHPINSKIRIQCAEGYVRKAGTSNLIHCTEINGSTTWYSGLPLECIADPKKPKTEMPHTTSPTTERTETKNPTVLSTSISVTATGHVTLTTIKEVATTKTRRTTNQPTLKSTAKEAESITTTNKITSTSSSFTSRDYVKTASSHSTSSSFTSITGQMESSASDYTSTVGGVTFIIIIVLVATVFFVLWRWRLRHRETNGIPLYHTNPADCTSYTPVSGCEPENCSAEPNKEANNPTTHTVHDTNQPQTVSVQDGDTYDSSQLLQQTDSC